MAQTAAVVISAINDVAIKDVTLTALAPYEVAVQTLYTSISAGTERMLMAGQMPHPMLQFPVIPGYETVGQICAAGSDVPSELLGQLVYVGGARCYEGVNPAWGGQAGRLHIDYRRVVTLDGVTPAHGVLLALAATAMHGVDIAGDINGKRVLVVGQGPVGQLAARIAMLRGADVSVVDKNPHRLAHSRATSVFDVSQTALSEQTTTAFDVIIEASGSSEMYSLLKREDEKAVTERAYENPVFVEDLVRNVALRLNQRPGLSWYRVEAENQESIHNHNAYALIERR